MQRLPLYRQIQSSYLIQKLKKQHGKPEIMKKQLLNFSSGTNKAKGNRYVIPVATAALGVTTTFGILIYCRGSLENCPETSTASSIDKPNVPASLKNNVPDVDPVTYRLTIECSGTSPTALSLDYLKNNFPKYTVTTALKCAGNCKSDHAEVKTNEWIGARLLDVLKATGYTEKHVGAYHIQFEGMDFAVPGMHYGVSIPFKQAIDPTSNIILAYELNGKPLSKDNGFPIRVLMPGIPAGRQIKWLGRIIIYEEEE